MLYEVMEFFGLDREFQKAGFFEAEDHKRVARNLKMSIKAGHLVALIGIVGSGKTTLVRKVKQELAREGETIVCSALAVDKDRVTLNTLMVALFHDVVTEKNFKIPASLEFRERKLRDVIRRRGKSVALFVDEAHELQIKTLAGLKRLKEIIQEGGAQLSIVLVGHPKLKVDLRRSPLEEIGARASVIALEL